MTTILDDLWEIVGSEQASAAESVRRLHSQDQSNHAGVMPDVVVWPANTAEVSAIARYANEKGVPLVGWGAGTSLEGNSIPVKGGIVVDFGRMNQILTVHVEDFQVTVQPGIFYKDMNKVLARHGLFFAPDPGANASIGGMIANNAAGIRTVRYGATRDNVLALEIVLANGDVVNTGSRSVKQSAGYDLTHLFIGSEGTLGLITEATLKLAPLPEKYSAVISSFQTVTDAADAVYGIIGSGLNPSALELMDAATVDMLQEDLTFEMVPAPTLFMEFASSSEAILQEALRQAEELCAECGALSFVAGLGPDMRTQLWEARHRILEIMLRLHPGEDWITTDVAVPISAYPALVSGAAELLEEVGLTGGLVGHAGDGNLHVLVFYDEASTDSRERVKLFSDRLVELALSYAGTSTGEHGVGLGKRKYMVREHGENGVALMRSLKAWLDPRNILNPGKVV